MVEVYKRGAYLMDGRIVWADEAPGQAAEAREKTIAYSILRAHNRGGDPGKLRLKFDALISHDITFVGIIQTAKASGLEKFPVPYAMTNCHNSLCAVGGTSTRTTTPSASQRRRSTAASTSPPTRR